MKVAFLFCPMIKMRQARTLLFKRELADYHRPEGQNSIAAFPRAVKSLLGRHQGDRKGEFMREICLILILSFSVFSQAAEKFKVVYCEGSVRARSMNGKTFDQGKTKMAFVLTDSATMKRIRVVTKFSKIQPQSIEAFESRATKRAIASGKFKADFFNIGHNGACQIGLGYEGDLARSTKPLASWGVFMMGCGNYAVVGNLKCQMK